LFFGAWNFPGLNPHRAPRTSHPAFTPYFLMAAAAEGKKNFAARVSKSKYLDTLSKFI